MEAYDSDEDWRPPPAEDKNTPLPVSAVVNQAEINIELDDAVGIPSKDELNFAAAEITAFERGAESRNYRSTLLRETDYAIQEVFYRRLSLVERHLTDRRNIRNERARRAYEILKQYYMTHSKTDYDTSSNKPNNNNNIGGRRSKTRKGKGKRKHRKSKTAKRRGRR